MPRLMLATSAAHRDLTPADQLYRAALERRGAEVEAGIWSDAGAGFRDADLVIIRSTWDYHRDLAGYRAWLDSLEQAGTAVANPVSLVRWNLEKTYLDDLASAGIPVPAQHVLPCDLEAARRTLAESGWRQAVAKPSVGASGHGVNLVTAATLDTSWDELASAVSPHKLVLQEYVSEIQAEGQTSYVFLGGRFVHAVRFRPRAGEFRINSKFEPQREVITPRDSDIEDAARAIAALPVSPLYARIDMVRREGRQLLLEAEVNEPGLLFQYAPAGADIFAIETLAWLERYGGDNN
jgi:glutathione synthase/RimK-type ligase-like ATP-grasp enzyme